jgi:hypothetical protein
MISDIFHNIIRIGADDQTDDRRHSELKLINSISLHSFIFTLLSAIAGLIIMPEHWMLIVFVALTEMIGKTAVLMLNSIRKFMAAKVVFTFITLISFLTIVAYFGVGLNFQYLIITTFFTLVIVFRNGNPDEILLTGLYLLIGMISLALIYIYDQPIVLLSESEIWIGRFP